MCTLHKNISEGVVPRVQQLQRSRCTGPQHAARMVLYEMCQKLATSGSGWSEYKTFDTFFAEEKGVLFTSKVSRKVTSQLSESIESLHFPYPTNDMLPEEDEGDVFKGDFNLDL